MLKPEKLYDEIQNGQWHRGPYLAPTRPHPRSYGTEYPLSFGPSKGAAELPLIHPTLRAIWQGKALYSTIRITRRWTSPSADLRELATTPQQTDLPKTLTTLTKAERAALAQRPLTFTEPAR